METGTKKSIKMTTAPQFQKLIRCMEEYPHLATGSPQFGSSKFAMDQTWEEVAKQVNAYGPPARTGSEWKKVWADLKCRLKKKIADNNRSINQTGGGPCRVSNLTDFEIDVDRICHISTAAAPGGKVCGLLPKVIPALTPPRGGQNIAVVSPAASSVALQSKDAYSMEWTIYEQHSVSPPTTSKKAANQETSADKYCMSKAVSSTPKDAERIQRKRKHSAVDTEGQERIKLLRQQSEIQAKTLKAIQTQAEAAKDCAEALKECTNVLETQADSLKLMTESMNLMAKGIRDIVKHLTEEY